MKLDNKEREMLISQIAEKAKEKHKEMSHAFLWGASSVLLKDSDLKIILKLFGDNK